MNPAPNQRLEHAAWQTRQLAQQTTNALNHINHEIHRYDGWPTKGNTKTHTSDITDNTANHATARHELGQLQQDINEWIGDIETRLQAGGRLLGVALRTRVPEPKPEPTLCRDGAHGKTLSPALTAQIVTCWEHPHKSGLCCRHYQAWYRARKKEGATK